MEEASRDSSLRGTVQDVVHQLIGNVDLFYSVEGDKRSVRRGGERQSIR